MALAPFACTGDDDGGDDRNGGGGASVPAGAVTVAEALAADDGTNLTVAGFLIALRDGTVSLCGGAIRESAPPQCGGPELPVEGVGDPAGIPGARDLGTWIEGDVTVTGTMLDGRLDTSG